MPTFYDFAGTLVDLFQNGFLARQLEEGLDTYMAYRRHATEIMVDGRIGSQITIPRVGRKGPVTVALNAAGLTANLDNSLSPSLPAIETYALTLMEWGDTADVDLIGSTAAAADLVKMASRTNGVQAAQSIERLAKIAYHTAYEGGNTWVRGDLSGTTLTTIRVDDVRGFLTVPVNGVPTPVSSLNPLPCYEMRTTPGGFNQQFNVTGVTIDNPNVSLYPYSSLDGNGNPIPDGISGVLAISGATNIPAGGDAIIAANAAKVVRPFNKPSYNILNSGDAATLGTLLDSKTRLEQNAVPTMRDYTYHYLYNPAVMRQLLADQQFIVAYAARKDSEEIKSGQIFVIFGITFIPTTEAYVQAANPLLGIKTTIRRSIMIGDEALLQADYAGLEMYLNVDGLDPLGGVMMVNGVAQIIRPPIDRMLRVLSLTWTWVGAFVAPTDATATPLIIPTASNALYKRACVIQTAG